MSADPEIAVALPEICTVEVWFILKERENGIHLAECIGHVCFEYTNEL